MNHRRDETDNLKTGRGLFPGPFFVSRQSLAKVFTFLEGGLFMGMVVVAGTIGLIRLAFHVARPDLLVGAAESAGAIAVDRYEVRRIRLPRTLVELAQSSHRTSVTKSHAQLRRYLEERHEENLWYSYTDRVYQRNGHYCDCTYVKHLYDDPFLMTELRDLLAAVATSPPHFESEAFANVSVIVMPETD
jgi:hypothetical protein